MTVNNELESILKETVVCNLKYSPVICL